MPNDLTNKGPQDQSRISLLEPHEVQYWDDKFGVSKERLSEVKRGLIGILEMLSARPGDARVYAPPPSPARITAPARRKNGSRPAAKRSGTKKRR